MVINRTKTMAGVCDAELFSWRSLRIPLWKQSSEIEISKADVLLSSLWLCVSLGNLFSNGKAEISKVWLQGIPCLVMQASEQRKEGPATLLLEQCC